MNTAQHFPLFIAGLPSKSRDKIEVTAPYDDAVIGSIDIADSDDIEQALSTAKQLFADKKNWSSVPQRIAILERAIELMQDQFEELALGSAHEGGKPLIDSRVEMARCIDSIRACVDNLRDNTCHPVPMGINPASLHRHTIMSKEPIGVVVAVSAFNHPLNLIAHQVGPAIALVALSSLNQQLTLLYLVFV